MADPMPLARMNVIKWSPRIPKSIGRTRATSAAKDMLAPVGGKLFFAGEMLGGEAQSTVHGAAFSAIKAVERMTG